MNTYPQKTILGELDVFYISYDEPRCEEFWSHTLDIAPWAKRVHGVTGFDSAHKECARQSETDRFLTIDGDNKVDPSLFDKELTIEEQHKDAVISYGSMNMVNSLIYGNGGVKCWPVDVVLNMKTHENSERVESAVDFCWDLDYLQVNECYSVTYPNGSPFQAFRAGFREGVKMSLADGKKVESEYFAKRLWKSNLDRLKIWCSVGSDAENGVWCIFGARLGCHMLNFDEDFEIESIRDYEYFNDFWNYIQFNLGGDSATCERSKMSWDSDKLYAETVILGNDLRNKLGLDVAELDETASIFFKSVYVNRERQGLIR